MYGVCAYQFSPFKELGLKLSCLGFAIGAGLLFFGIAHGEIVINVSLTPIIFGLAYTKKRLPSALNWQTDYSYGLYIFHWPIYQTLMNLFPNAPTFPLLLFAGLPLAFIAAGLSWKFIEKPALKLKKVSALKLT